MFPRPPRAQTAPIMNALEHQRGALAEITARARAFFRGGWHDLPIQPRWPTLIVGPTGTGKTTLAAMAAEAVGASILRVSAPSWMPAGAHNRSTRETIAVIAEHVAGHDKTILVADELDKIISGPGGATRGGGGGGGGMDGGSPWQSYVRNEIYDLLDSRWPTGLADPDTIDDDDKISLQALTKKLKQSVYIVGCGTFQDYYDSAAGRRSMGFAAQVDHEIDQISAEIVAEKLPRELANRFNGKLIRLPELTPNDYHRIAEEATNKLPARMRDTYRIEVARLIPEAIAAKKGIRFLEEAMLQVLVQLPESEKIPEVIAKPNPEIPELDLCTP